MTQLFRGVALASCKMSLASFGSRRRTLQAWLKSLILMATFVCAADLALFSPHLAGGVASIDVAMSFEFIHRP